MTVVASAVVVKSARLATVLRAADGAASCGGDRGVGVIWASDACYPGLGSGACCRRARAVYTISAWHLWEAKPVRVTRRVDEDVALLEAYALGEIDLPERRC